MKAKPARVYLSLPKTIHGYRYLYRVHPSGYSEWVPQVNATKFFRSTAAQLIRRQRKECPGKYFQLRSEPA